MRMPVNNDLENPRLGMAGLTSCRPKFGRHNDLPEACKQPGVCMGVGLDCGLFYEHEKCPSRSVCEALTRPGHLGSILDRHRGAGCRYVHEFRLLALSLIPYMRGHTLLLGIAPELVPGSIKVRSAGLVPQAVGADLGQMGSFFLADLRGRRSGRFSRSQFRLGVSPVALAMMPS
jgi:hypothetical protein